MYIERNHIMLDLFETSDIVLAAYLKLNKIKLVSIERVGNKGTFIFSLTDKKLIDDYDLGLSLVEPKSLNYEIKTLTTAARR